MSHDTVFELSLLAFPSVVSTLGFLCHHGWQHPATCWELVPHHWVNLDFATLHDVDQVVRVLSVSLFVLFWIQRARFDEDKGTAHSCFASSRAWLAEWDGG